MPDGERLAAAGIDAAADDHRRVVGQVEDVRVAQVRDLRNEHTYGIHIADLDVPTIQLGDALQIRRVAIVDDALPVKDGALYRRGEDVPPGRQPAQSDDRVVNQVVFLL